MARSIVSASVAAMAMMLMSCSSDAFVQPSASFGSPRSRTLFRASPDMDSDPTTDDDMTQGSMSEFVDLEPLPETETRRLRLQREAEVQSQFAKFGDELWDLRSELQELSVELLDAINNDEKGLERRIRRQMRKVERRDPDLVYRRELDLMKEAELNDDREAAAIHKESATNARSCLPQFNLQGLWVGKYGNQGYEMINVTYSGDTLVAYKVTGDKNVPRGEVSFKADLSPFNPDQRKDSLPPITLTESAAKKWGTKLLPRHKGLGCVAEEGFKNSQWMDGQLIIIGEEYFSFAWVPLEFQIFFGRPSPDLALKMLRDGGSATLRVKNWDAPPSENDDITAWQDYMQYCFERTERMIDEDMMGDEFGSIWRGFDIEEAYFQ